MRVRFARETWMKRWGRDQCKSTRGDRKLDRRQACQGLTWWVYWRRDTVPNCGYYDSDTEVRQCGVSLHQNRPDEHTVTIVTSLLARDASLVRLIDAIVSGGGVQLCKIRYGDAGSAIQPTTLSDPRT